MHYFTLNTPPNPKTKGTPYRVPSGQDPWVWPDNPAYPPQPHLRYPLTSKDEDPNKKILARQSCSRAQRTILFYLAYPAYHALLHTKHATSSTTEGTPYRVPSGQDPWVWPDNPAYPPWPHLRYPLTSKDEDPNKKILTRQSCSRAQRILLFYLLYNSTTQKTNTTSRKSTAVVHNLATEEDAFHNISMLGAISRYTNTDTNIIAVQTSTPYGASEEETQRIMRNARNESLPHS